MDRKHFLVTSLGIGMLGQRSATAQEAAPAVSECEKRMRFAEGWVASLMESADATLDEPQRVRLMEARGRACARGGAIRAAQEARGDVDKLVATMAGWLGPQAARREAAKVHVTYSSCLCPLAKDIKAALSPTYCHCSCGWLKEMFETASAKPVRVERVETIKSGGRACRFVVHLLG